VIYPCTHCLCNKSLKRYSETPFSLLIAFTRPYLYEIVFDFTYWYFLSMISVGVAVYCRRVIVLV